MNPTAYPDSPRTDLVREHTNPAVNEQIDHQTLQNLRDFAPGEKSAVDYRLRELDREWDMERVLEANAAGVTLGALFLAATVSRKFLLLPAVVAGFLLHHAVRGWCPPVPLFRKYGVRTRKEIERERTALRIMKGDLKSEVADPAEALRIASK